MCKCNLCIILNFKIKGIFCIRCITIINRIFLKNCNTFRMRYCKTRRVFVHLHEGISCEIPRGEFGLCRRAYLAEENGRKIT